MSGVLSAPRGVSGRRRAILDYVTMQGPVSVAALGERFVVNRISLSRDLQMLVAQGLLRKVGNAVTAWPSGVSAGSVMYRLDQAVRQKAAIAGMAASMIRPGDTVALDDSTTVRFLADHLEELGSLTVITNSLGLGMMAGRLQDVTLIGLGGHYSTAFDAFAGVLCERSLATLRIDTLFMSAGAIHGTAAYHQDEDLIKIKTAMMRQADWRVLMVDSRKFGISVLNRLADLSEFDVVITDDGISPEQVERLASAGVALRIATVSHAERAAT
ncbi:DeoR/GlpR family DNA-binding transcription regulator [Gluconobacter morbifer]|uniref:HTH deoR-type domain-containing protein n=1 Tax=Gluconobacter morbifer G707 TaxID=1088869 RepID=G6XL07_9PROT|nr:DeoR/GlpR family DNA-binding transcription regulator [Gluconobacter morbifer]EHH67435.1 hypothetical protein GMO_24300 [Gluconobacter morbifer G707]